MASVKSTRTKVASTSNDTASPSTGRSNQAVPAAPTARPTAVNTMGAVTGDMDRPLRDQGKAEHRDGDDEELDHGGVLPV